MIKYYNKGLGILGPDSRLLTEGYASIFYGLMGDGLPPQQEMKMNKVHTYECSFCKKRGDRVTRTPDHGNQYPDGWAIVRTFRSEDELAPVRYHDDTACKACVPKHKKKK